MSNGTELECTKLTDICTFEESVYGYKPSLGANAFFAAFFGICCVVNLVLGIRYRTWSYMVAVGAGCLLETIGYAGRLIMRDNPFADSGFIVSLHLKRVLVPMGTLLTTNRLKFVA